MSVNLNAKVFNLDGLVANLFENDKRAQAAIRKVVERNGKRLKAQAEKDCPYDTSKPPKEFHMRDHVRLEPSDDGLVARVGFLRKDFTEADPPQPPYFKFVLEGTVNQTANPFLKRAQNTTYPRFKADLSVEVRRAMKRTGSL